MRKPKLEKKKGRVKMLVGKGVAVVIAFRDGAAERRERGEKKGKVSQLASQVREERRKFTLLL